MVGKIFVKEVGFEPGVEKRRSYKWWDWWVEREKMW